MQLDKKIGGLPVKVWLGVAIAGLALGLYLRHRSAQSGASPNTSAGTVGDNALSTGVPASTGDLTTGLAGGGIAPTQSGFDPSTTDQLLSGQATLAQGEQNLIDAIGALAYSMPSSGGSGASADSSGAGTSTPYAPAPAPIRGAVRTAPFGGVLDTRTSKTGVKITTFRSGRVVEKAPGKSAYVARSSAAAPRAVAKAAPKKAAPKPAPKRKAVKR